jgi:hypothetical protein
LGFGGFGNVATYGHGFATCCGDGGHNFIRAGFAGRVVDDYGCAFCGERFSDGCADALGCAGNDCDFTF